MLFTTPWWLRKKLLLLVLNHQTVDTVENYVIPSHFLTVCVFLQQVRLEMYKKYFKTIGLAIIIPIVFLYAFQQGASLAYNYWLSMWADDPVVNGTQIDTDLKLAVFGALGFAQGQFSIIV